MNDIREKITELINNYYDEGFFVGNTEEYLIKEIEIKLGIILPESYKWYVKTYGCGGIGFDIIGVGKGNNLSVVNSTEKYRKYGLAKGLVVVEDVGEWVYCLDTDRIKDSECPVVTWSIHDKDGAIERNDTFYEYLLDSLNEAIDNL